MEKATNVMLPAFAMEVNPCMWEREHDAKVVAEMKAVAPKVRATIEKRTSSKLVMDVTVVNKEGACLASTKRPVLHRRRALLYTIAVHSDKLQICSEQLLSPSWPTPSCTSSLILASLECYELNPPISEMLR
jgi:hypothetical protein